MELGVVIGKAGRDIPKDKAMDYVAGYSELPGLHWRSQAQRITALAIDMTARNVQDAAKKKSYPWTVAKGYDTFCPVGSVADRAMYKA